MATLTTYNINKRKNSTMLPSGAGGSIDVVLKNTTSFLSPTFLVSATLIDWNYCLYNGRYYFVTDVVSERNNLWEVHCVEDYLATWKAAILASAQYVEYSSNVFSEKLYDPRCQQLTDCIWTTANATFPPSQAASPYNYLLTVNGKNTGAVTGFSTMFLVTPTELGLLNNALYTDSVLEELVQFITNPLETVVACRQTGLTPSHTAASEIVLGTYATNINAAKVTNTAESYTVNVSIPWHYSDFRRMPQWTSATLFLPYVGWVNLNTSDFLEADSLMIRCLLDFAGCEVVYLVYGTEGEAGNPIGMYQGNFGADVPVSNAQMGIGSMGAGVGIVAAATQLANPWARAAGFIAGGANLAEGLFGRSYTMTGGYGGNAMALQSDNIVLALLTRTTRQEPSLYAPIIGRPCMQTIPLATCIGYLQTSNASVSAVGMIDEERTTVNNMLDGGVYIE